MCALTVNGGGTLQVDAAISALSLSDSEATTLNVTSSPAGVLGSVGVAGLERAGGNPSRRSRSGAHRGRAAQLALSPRSPNRRLRRNHQPLAGRGSVEEELGAGDQGPEPGRSALGGMNWSLGSRESDLDACSWDRGRTSVTPRAPALPSHSTRRPLASFLAKNGREALVSRAVVVSLESGMAILAMTSHGQAARATANDTRPVALSSCQQATLRYKFNRTPRSGSKLVDSAQSKPGVQHAESHRRHHHAGS